jgi:hypothetical protein
MLTSRGRVVPTSQVAFDQVDFFQGDGFTRVTGLTASVLSSQIFFSNVQQPWFLVPGLFVTDTQVASGAIYFNEIPSAPGFYTVRWRPNGVGYWRLLISYVAGLQIEVTDYDVVSNQSVAPGLSASFIRPDC